ncbi:MAG: SIMPL domain-containing protein, partial [Nitrososphaerota archaeon]|nr:SIMPL domain-containing protein [Nitrososphaerota archaeon]
METLNKLVLILGIVAVTTIGVNLTILIGFYSASRSLSIPYYELESTGVSKFSPYPYIRDSLTIVDQEKRTIIVSGTGIAKAKPDKVLISLGIITQGENAKDAVYENAVKTGIVINSLKAMGINEKHIEISVYNLTPIWDYYDNNMLKITGYSCHTTILVVITNINMIEEVINRAISTGANQVSSIQFTVSDETLRQLESEALRNAIKDAELKAKILANAAQATLLRLISISIMNSSLESSRTATLSMGVISTPITPFQEVGVKVSISAI